MEIYAILTALCIFTATLLTLGLMIELIKWLLGINWKELFSHIFDNS